jgi:NAD(P)-dependent dehydrogenase (short-subunit alcohol dehydrogenase family)
VKEGWGNFSNKVAVVTSGSRGIGRGIALEFASLVAWIVIVSSSAESSRQGHYFRIRANQSFYRPTESTALVANDLY